MKKLLLLLLIVLGLQLVNSQTYTNTQSGSCATVGCAFNLSFPGAPLPGGNGTLSLTYYGDLDLASEFFTVFDEGNNSLGNYAGATQCGTYSTVINLSQAQINTWASNGSVVFTFDGSADVNNLGGSCNGNALAITNATLSYPSLSASASISPICVGGSTTISTNPSFPNVSTTLATTSIAGNGCGAGNMFDITTGSSSVTLTGFTVQPNLTGAQTVNLYRKTGTYVGSETNAGAWTFVGSYAINGTNGAQTYINTADFTIPGNSTYGIYVNYNSDYTTGANTYSDAYITIDAGVGLCSQFGGVNNPRTFNGIVHYSVLGGSWSPTSGLSNPNSSSTTASPSSTTTYSFTPNGSSGSASVTVTVNPQPSISITSGTNQSICTGGNGNTFTASITGGIGCGYQWQQSNDGVFWSNIGGATGASYTPTGLTRSTFYRCATINCATTCNQTTSQERFIAVTPTPSIQTQPSPASLTVCEGNEVSYATQANLGTGSTKYRLVLTSAHSSGWHGIQEIQGYNVSGTEETLSCEGASSSTYTDVMCNASGGSYSADNAFDGIFNSGSSSTVQWLTPENTGAGNTNYQNYSTSNPFYSPEWIEFSSNQPLAEIWVYNGRYAPSSSDVSDCFKDYYVLVSYDNGTTWNKVKEGTFNAVNGLDGNNNKLNIEPNYTWKQGGVTVGTGKELNLTPVAGSDAGTYLAELDYGCGVASTNSLSLAVSSGLSATAVVTPSPCSTGCEASIDFEITGGIAPYTLNEFWEGFDGTTLSDRFIKDDIGTYTQNNELSISHNVSAWNKYFYTNQTFEREAGKTFSFRYYNGTQNWNMIGWHGNGNTDATRYRNIVYALYFQPGGINIYEDGNSRGNFNGNIAGGFSENTWYDCKIILKSSGADYYVKKDGQTAYSLLYSSSYSAETDLRLGSTFLRYNTVITDNWYVYNENQIDKIFSLCSSAPSSNNYTITDAAGCSVAVSAVVPAPPPSLSLTATPNSESCPGACDGSVTLTGNGGVAPYTYAGPSIRTDHFSGNDIGLILHLPLDNSTEDISPTAQAAGTNNGVTFANGAGDFSTSTGIDMGPKDGPYLTAATTISYWIYKNNNALRENPFDQAYGGWGTHTVETNGAISWFFGANGGNAVPYGSHQSPAGTVTTGEWIHIACSRNPATNTYVWFKNGTAISSGTYDPSYPVINNRTLTIGDGYVSPINGQLADFRIYNRVLHPDEVSEIHERSQEDYIFNKAGGTLSHEGGVIRFNNDNDAWDMEYYSKETYTRVPGKTFQGQIKLDQLNPSRAMIGWRDQGTNGNTYANLVHAIYFTSGGSIVIYESGNYRANVGSFTFGQWYDIKIELLATGAVYYMKAVGSSTWTTIYTSTFSAHPNLSPGISHLGAAGLYIDNWNINDPMDEIAGLCPGTTLNYTVIDANGCTASDNTSIPFSTASFSTDFESQAQGGTVCGNTQNLSSSFFNATNDDLDWVVDAGGTGSVGTGPSSGDLGTTKYAYVEASNACANNTNEAILVSECLSMGSDACNDISFSYHQYSLGNLDMGELYLEVSTDGISWTSLWSTGPNNLGNQWNRASVDLNAYDNTTIVLRFRRVLGNTYEADLAIDEIVVNNVSSSSYSAPTISCPGTQTLTAGVNCLVTLPDYTSTGTGCLKNVTQSPAPGTSLTPGSTSVTLTIEDAQGFTANCSFTVNVNTPALNAGTIGNAQTICAGGNPTTLTNIAAASTAASPFVYQWEEDDNIGFSSPTPVTGTSSSFTTFDPPALTSTTYYRRSVENSCGSKVYSNVITITVVPDPSISVSGGITPICLGESFGTLTASASGGTGTQAYQWQVNINGGGWTNVGANSNTYVTPATNVQGTYQYRCIRTATGNGCGTATSAAITRTVTTAPYELTDFEDQALGSLACGASQTLTSPFFNATNDDLDWSIDDDGVGSSGGTGPGSGDLGTSKFAWVEASSGCANNTNQAILVSECLTMGANSCNDIAFSFHQYSSMSVDMGELYLEVSTNGTSWTQLWVTGPNSIGDFWNRASVDLSAYNGQTIVLRFRRVLGNSYEADIALDEIVVNNVSSSSYSAPSISCPSTQTLVAGANCQVALPDYTSAGTGCLKTVTQSPAAGTLISAGSNVVTLSIEDAQGFTASCSFTVNVDAPSLATGTIGNPQTICSGSNPAALTNTASASGAATPITYQWQFSTNGFSTGFNIGGATGLTYDPPVLTATTYYRRRAIDACGALVYSNIIEITVIPNPTTANAGSSMETCLDGTVSLGANNPTIGTGTWTWSPTAPTYVGGTSANDYNAQVVFNTPGSYTGTWTISNSPCSSSVDNMLVDVYSVSTNAYLVSGSSTTAIEACVESPWTYYADPAKPDEYIFGIKKNGNTFTADITITDLPGTATYSSTGGAGPDRGTWLIGRYWNAELTSGSISSDVDIRFFVDLAEIAQAENEANTFLNSTIFASDITPLSFFKTTGSNFDPATAMVGGDFTFTPTYLPYTTGAIGGVSYVEMTGITSFSGGTGGFSVNDDGATLPVELLSFDATAIDNEFIRLDWATATEINNDGFELLRSTDGISFERIAWIEGNGNSTNTHEYVYDDYEVAKGITYYYQLKQIDFDGQYEYFDIVTAKLEGKDAFYIGNLIPNPNRDNQAVRVEVQTSIEEKVSVQVFNHVGVRVASFDMLVQNGQNNLKFDISNLADGTYFLNFESAFGTETRKLVIIR